MGSLPVALTALLATGALLAFLVTLFAAPRARRRDLAVLRTIGLSRSQIRKTLFAQALVTVAIALTIGLPLGIIAGRLTWIRYAHDIGVLPDPTVPVLTIVAIAVGTAALCRAPQPRSLRRARSHIPGPRPPSRITPVAPIDSRTESPQPRSIDSPKGLTTANTAHPFTGACASRRLPRWFGR